MKKKVKKKIIKPFDMAAFELHNNGLYRMKVIPNKKKEQNNRKKFQLNKEMSGYSSTFNGCGNPFVDISFPKVF